MEESKKQRREWSFSITAVNGREWLSMNDRRHFMAHAKAVKRWRSDARILATALRIPQLESVHIRAEIYKPKAGRYDPHNLFPTLKSIIDGVVDAGVVADDDHRHLTTTLAHGGVDKSQPPHIMIRIIEGKKDD